MSLFNESSLKRGLSARLRKKGIRDLYEEQKKFKKEESGENHL